MLAPITYCFKPCKVYSYYKKQLLQKCCPCSNILLSHLQLEIIMHWKEFKWSFSLLKCNENKMIKNKSHIVYGLFEVSTKNRTENFCNNVLCALMQFSVLFWLIPRSTKKISYSFLKWLDNDDDYYKYFCF